MTLEPDPMKTLAEVRAELPYARRELRSLLVLEVVQVGFGIVALVAIAVRSVLSSPSRPVALSIAAVVGLALAYVAFGVRVRLGREQLSARLQRHEPSPDTVRHPYRTPAESRQIVGRVAERLHRRHAVLLVHSVVLAIALGGGAVLLETALRGLR